MGKKGQRQDEGKCMCISTINKSLLSECISRNRGGSRIFSRRGSTRLLLYFNTNKPHSFFCRIPVVLENYCRSSRGEGGAHPLHPPPRSAPEKERLRRVGNYVWMKTNAVAWWRDGGSRVVSSALTTLACVHLPGTSYF